VSGCTAGLRASVQQRAWHASARHLTPYGLAECAWKIEHGTITLDVIIPPNTTALVSLAVLEQVGAPGFLNAIIFNECNLPMRQVLHMLPNEDAAVALLNTALANRIQID
jgi:hypothetical protein